MRRSQRVRLHFAPTRLVRSLGEDRRDRKVIMVNDPKRVPFGEYQCLDLTYFPFRCAGENSAPDQIEPRMPRSGSRGPMTPDILSQTELTAGRTVSQGNAASGFPCSYSTATESSTSPNFLSGFFKNESYPVRYACSNCA